MCQRPVSSECHSCDTYKYLLGCVVCTYTEGSVLLSFILLDNRGPGLATRGDIRSRATRAMGGLVGCWSAAPRHPTFRGVFVMQCLWCLRCIVSAMIQNRGYIVMHTYNRFYAIFTIVFISLWDIQFLPTRSVFTFFQTFLNFWSNAPKCRHLGGVCVCFTKSVRKRRFRNVGLGGG